MTKEYQPKIYDEKGEIRKAVQSIRKKTRLEKAVIVERLLRAAINQADTIFKNE